MDYHTNYCLSREACGSHVVHCGMTWYNSEGGVPKSIACTKTFEEHTSA